MEIRIPDIGDFEDVEIIEILVSAGDTVAAESSLITVESDKAAMEIPSPVSGTIAELHVSLGDRVREGTLIALITTDDAAEEESSTESSEQPPLQKPSTETETTSPPSSERADASTEATPPPSSDRAGASMEAALLTGSARERSSTKLGELSAPPHASPSVRRFARELGAELAHVCGSGRKGRITREDVQDFVKQALTGSRAASTPENVLLVDPPRRIDFSKYGEIEVRELNSIRRAASKHLHRSWVTVPHVTQFDDADITEIEAYRKDQKAESEKRAVKLTLLAFLLKATVSALKEFPNFCASLDASCENLILKRYYHIGVAVETPNGLVVPVLRDVDRKGLFELASELSQLSERARNGRLEPAQLSGGCFSISSLGGIGGTAFTPIINAPEVAILGVSRHGIKPVLKGKKFIPRLILPLSLSYDHRVIDGAEAARFTTTLKDILSDVRKLAL